MYLASVLILFHIWVGYYLLLRLMSFRRALKQSGSGLSLFVTVLVAARNEQAAIKLKLENILQSDYPRDKYEIVVASDGSTDNTDTIVTKLIDVKKGIRLLRTKGGGKSAAQNEAIPCCNGEIIVLTDVDTAFQTDTLKNLVSGFADNKVGCVAGKLVLRRDKNFISDSQSFYWKYETRLRMLESQIGILHTCSGAIMAFRRSVIPCFEQKYGDDCVIPLDVIAKGYKVLFQDSAVAYDSFPSTIKGELRRRATMTSRNFSGTLLKTQTLNPFRYPLLSFGILSHRLLRWLTPYFLICFLCANLLLFKAGLFFEISLGLQAAFYLLGSIGFISDKVAARIPVASHVASFLLANAGFFLGVGQLILRTGNTDHRWSRSGDS